MAMQIPFLHLNQTAELFIIIDVATAFVAIAQACQVFLMHEQVKYLKQIAEALQEKEKP